eukprot:3160577-Karenia_brevis.AAC.1
MHGPIASWILHVGGRAHSAHAHAKRVRAAPHAHAHALSARVRANARSTSTCAITIASVHPNQMLKMRKSATNVIAKRGIYLSHRWATGSDARLAATTVGDKVRRRAMGRACDWGVGAIAPTM